MWDSHLLKSHRCLAVLAYEQRCMDSSEEFRYRTPALASIRNYLLRRSQGAPAPRGTSSLGLFTRHNGLAETDNRYHPRSPLSMARSNAPSDKSNLIASLDFCVSCCIHRTPQLCDPPCRGPPVRSARRRRCTPCRFPAGTPQDSREPWAPATSWR